MSVSNGEIANQDTFNNAFASKQNNNTLDGIQTLINATQATTTGTGALVIAGGLGLGGNAFVGGLLDVFGTVNIQDGTESTTPATGSVKLAGGLGVTKNINAGGNIVATGTMSASNLSGSNSGDVTVGTFSATPSAQGISIVGQSLTLHAASNTIPGAVSIGTQSFGGNKTFNNDLTIVGNFTFSGKTLANTVPTDGQVVRYDSVADAWQKDGSNGYDANSATESVAGAGTITKLSTGRKSQMLRVQGSGGPVVLANAPLGSTIGLSMGSTFLLIGASDVNTVRINHADVAGGCLLNGDAILGDGNLLSLIYDSDRDRFVEISRNFE